MPADGGGFLVNPATLKTGAEGLEDDAAGVWRTGGNAAGAVEGAVGACGGLALAAALADFAAELDARTRTLSQACEQGGEVLRSNRANYLAADTGAAASLGTTFS